MERTPFSILNISLKIMRKRSGKFFFSFLFFFKRLDFSEKLARVSSVFRTFPNLQNLRKHLKTLLIFQSSTILNFRFRTHRPQPNQTQYIHIYIYIHLFISIIKTFKTSSNLCICFYQKIGLEPDLSRPPTYLVH